MTPDIINVSNRIINHLVEIGNGKCSITQEMIMDEQGDRLMAEILTGLLFLHEDLELSNRKRRLAEREGLEAERRYRVLAETAPDSIVLADRLGTITYLNPAAQKTFGYDSSEALGKTLTLLMPERFRDRHLQGFSRFLVSGEAHLIGKGPVEMIGMRKDGSEFPIEISLSSWKVFEAVYFSAFIRDVTVRKRTEIQLRRIEARWTAAIENVKDYAIFLLDSDGSIITWNKGAERINGYSADEVLGKNISILYPQEDNSVQKLKSELADAQEYGHHEDEGYRVRKDGSKFWANVIYTPIFDDQKKLIGFVKVARDLTERKQTEDQLKLTRDELISRTVQLEANSKELEAFAYSVSHDLRAPLRSADGFSKALLEEYSDILGENGRDYLNRIRAASQKMGQLIDDLLNLSRFTRKEMVMSEVDLSSIVEKVADELQKEDPNRKVKFIIAHDAITRGDKDLLAIAVQNLLNNAWKFTSKHQNATIEFGVNRQDEKTIYFVRDDGAGFDMSYVQKLFGAFQRLHKDSEFPGTGIGLATVQRIIHRHGGQVWAEGAMEQGATFYFTLEGSEQQSGKVES